MPPALLSNILYAPSFFGLSVGQSQTLITNKKPNMAEFNSVVQDYWLFFE
jgi:hypothetical protein